MAKLDALINDFLSQRVIAIVGVSDKRETGCNLAYRKFKEAGYTVRAVNPHQAAFAGDPCYPDLAALPEVPDAVFVLASPPVSEQVVRQCVTLGVKHVWLHCLMGTKPGLAQGMTSVSPEAVRLCREHAINVIPGTCPNQFLKPDFGHAAMRTIFRTLGFHSLN